MIMKTDVEFDVKDEVKVKVSEVTSLLCDCSEFGLRSEAHASVILVCGHVRERFVSTTLHHHAGT